MKALSMMFGFLIVIVAISFIAYTSFIIYEGATTTEKDFDRQLQEFINNY